MTLPLACGGGGDGGGDGGGGGSTPAPTATPTTNAVDPLTGGSMRLTVNWPARSPGAGRLVPVAAQALRFAVIAQTDTELFVVRTVTVARPPDDAPAPSDITIDGLPVRALTLAAAAYPTADATGIVQAQGRVTVTLSQDNYAQAVVFSADSTVDRLTLTGPRTRLAVGEQVSLSATAYDASGQVVLTRPESLRWQSDNPATLARPDDLGTFVANPAFGTSTVTVTETESGKTASLQLSVGFPLGIGLSVDGARQIVPLRADKADDSGAVFQLAPGGSFTWSNPQQFFSDVAIRGTPVTITAPATYGDRVFSGWVSNGVEVGSTPSLIVDPAQAASRSLVARYTQRSPDPTTGEYGPNFLRDQDFQPVPARANQVVEWDLSRTRVAFVTSGTYTPARRQAAIEGMNFWVQATANEFQYTLLDDDATADADIVVAFCTRQGYVPAPSMYGFADTAPVANQPASTLYRFTSGTTGAGGVRIGTGKRLIYLFTDGTDALPPVAAHELFHALGMAGHSSHPDDLMYGGGNGVSTDRATFPDERDMNSFLTVLQRRASRAARPSPNPAGSVQTAVIP